MNGCGGYGCTQAIGPGCGCARCRTERAIAPAPAPTHTTIKLAGLLFRMHQQGRADAEQGIDGPGIPPRLLDLTADPTKIGLTALSNTDREKWIRAAQEIVDTLKL